MLSYEIFCPFQCLVLAVADIKVPCSEFPKKNCLCLKLCFENEDDATFAHASSGKRFILFAHGIIVKELTFRTES